MTSVLGTTQPKNFHCCVSSSVSFSREWLSFSTNISGVIKIVDKAKVPVCTLHIIEACELTHSELHFHYVRYSSKTAFNSEN